MQVPHLKPELATDKDAQCLQQPLPQQQGKYSDTKIYKTHYVPLCYLFINQASNTLSLLFLFFFLELLDLPQLQPQPLKEEGQNLEETGSIVSLVVVSLQLMLQIVGLSMQVIHLKEKLVILEKYVSGTHI